jgi:Zn-dependent peptidase ImmA (M78 family)
MFIDVRTLGKKLRRYRDQLQETIPEVSRATRIAADRLDAMEAGLLSPTADEILILADHWSCDFAGLISDKNSEPFAETEILYRRHGEAFSKEDRRAVQEFLYLCETEAFLFRELGRPSQKFSFTCSGTHYKSHGEEAALALRKFLGYENGRPGAPRDIYNDFRKLGAHIFRRKLVNSNISGLFIAHSDAGPCLLVNYTEDVYRQRFSATHEMAHAIFDIGQQVVVSFVKSNQHDRLKEIRANRFASCYLMPPSMLKTLPDPSSWNEAETQHWVNEFRVSCEALSIALKDARRASESTCLRIRSLRVPKESKIDPELGENLPATARNRKRRLLEQGLSDFYTRLCFDAHNAGLISTGRLAEAMLADPTDLAEMAGLYGTSLRYGD